MKTILLTLLVYLTALVQASLLPLGPDLVLLTLVSLALHEEKLAATVLGALGGLVLDLSDPGILGMGALTFAAIAYIVSTARGYFYRARWLTVVLVLAGMTVRYGMLALAGAGPAPLSRLLTIAALTVALSPIVNWLHANTILRRWRSS